MHNQIAYWKQKLLFLKRDTASCRQGRLLFYKEQSPPPQQLARWFRALSEPPQGHHQLLLAEDLMHIKLPVADGEYKKTLYMTMLVNIARATDASSYIIILITAIIINFQDCQYCWGPLPISGQERWSTLYQLPAVISNKDHHHYHIAMGIITLLLQLCILPAMISPLIL